jgi:hypothetical protein
MSYDPLHQHLTSFYFAFLTIFVLFEYIIGTYGSFHWFWQ